MEDKSGLLDPSLDKQLKGHRGAITALCYSPNENQLASSSLDNSVLLWDLSGALRSYRFRGHDGGVTDVTFSPSGRHMASASMDKTVRLWVPTVTGSTGVFRPHSQTVRSVQFSPDGSKLITASDDKTVKIWSSNNYKFISSFVGHTNWVRCARMSADGSVIASCSDDKTTRLWNAAGGEEINSYKDQNGYGLHVAWHPSGCYIAVGTSLGNVKLYDIRTRSLVQYYSIHNEAVTQLAFHPSGSYILTASKDGKMKILDLLEGHPVFTLSGHSGAVTAVAFSPGGGRFATAGDDYLVNQWSTNFTELSADVKENAAQKSSPVPSHSSNKLAGSRSQDARQWYLCYHSFKYPVANYVQLDDSSCNERSCAFNRTLETINELEQPTANSTFNSSIQSGKTFTVNNSFYPRSSNSTSREYSHESNDSIPMSPTLSNREQPEVSTPQHSGSNTTGGRECSPNCPSRPHGLNDISHTPRVLRWGSTLSLGCQSTPKPDTDLECTFVDNSDNLNQSYTPQLNRSTTSSNANCTRRSLSPRKCEAFNDSSHIPRSCPPKPSNCTMPSYDKPAGCEDDDPHLYGLVRLTCKDVCYTSGTIEWVGRKRSFPVNTGFKTIDDAPCHRNKKVKTLDNSMSSKTFDIVRDCECADMLPTVNAIVDHLNALHEAVDLIDIRLNSVEGAVAID